MRRKSRRSSETSRIYAWISHRYISYSMRSVRRKSSASKPNKFSMSYWKIRRILSFYLPKRNYSSRRFLCTSIDMCRIDRGRLRMSFISMRLKACRMRLIRNSPISIRMRCSRKKKFWENYGGFSCVFMSVGGWLAFCSFNICRELIDIEKQFIVFYLLY